MRSASIAFAFTVLFGLIAILARAVALTTNGPWFSPSISLQMYSVTLLGSVVVALGVVALASSRASHLDEALLSMEIRLATLSRETGVDSRSLLDSPASNSRKPAQDIASVLDLLDAGEDTALDADPGGHDSLVEVHQVAPAAPTRTVTELQWDLVSQYRAVQTARERVWIAVAGPLIVSFVFLSISAAMLPGSDGFAQTNFQLNTTLILILAYGWWLLLGWSVLAVIMFPITSRKRRIFRPRLWELVE